MRLDLVVGPNGAGKSTFVHEFIEPERPGVPFVNADMIAADLWPDDPMGHSYEAAEIGARARQAYLDRGDPFIAETVFSHPSKLDLVRTAKAVGFEVRLFGILVPVEVTVARVLARVENGGHNVPERKIRERYDRLWALVAEAVLLVDVTRFYANHLASPTYVGGFADGLQIGALTWPAWVHPALPRKLGGTIEVG